MIPVLMQTNTLRFMLEQRFLNFIIEGISHDNFLVSNVFKNSIVYSSFILRNINSIFKKYNLSYEELFKNKRLVLKENINVDNWKVSVLKELIHMRDFKLTESLSMEEIVFIINQICVF